MKNQKIRIICEGAICIALAYALSFLNLNAVWVNGGSVSLATVPLVLFAVRRGPGWGVGAGVLYGVLDFLLSGGLAWGWQSMILDYLVAYAAVGLAGLARGRRFSLPIGAAIGVSARFVVHFISGITIYAIVAPTELMNITFTSPWMYSLVYNGSYMLPNLILAVVAGAFLQKPLTRFMETD